MTLHHSSALSHISVAVQQSEGKMIFLTIAFCLLLFVYDSSAVDIMPELKRNILNFGYGVNFKYEGILSHSFDRFYIVTMI